MIMNEDEDKDEDQEQAGMYVVCSPISKGSGSMPRRMVLLLYHGTLE